MLLTSRYLSRSLKELVKAVHSSLQSATLPLPDEIVHIIESFLSKHEGKSDEALADKLHEELIPIYHKDVAPIPSRYAVFVHLLRRLRPLIGQPARILQWFELLLPTLDHLNQEKGLAAESQNVVLEILTDDNGNDPSSPAEDVAKPLAERILIIWFKEVETIVKIGDPLQDFKERQLKEALVSYGKKHPKDFMTLIDQYVCKRVYRGTALLLLSVFVQSQPPHLYLILQTPLFNNILNCLLRDTATTVVSLALTVLTMILPHIPSSLVPHLPTLFNIYARLLFWDRQLSTEAATSDKNHILSPNALVWEKCAYAPEVDDVGISHLLSYFTVLYGLYPINFMDYIRKPQRYLRHADVPEVDDVEVQPSEIRYASERFRRCHLLHENFYTLTIDSEKTDFGRWIKSEPAEVTASCMALCQSAESFSDYAPLGLPAANLPERAELDEDAEESALLSSSLNHPTQPTLIRVSSHDSQRSNRNSPDTKTSGNESGSQTQLADLIESNKAVKAEFHQSLRNDSVPSLALSHHGSISERPLSQLHPIMPATNTPMSSNEVNNGYTAQLYRKMFLLYNDLTFERFMKQQHLTHIGELRRRHVREAASEAETQNLIIQNRNLKQRLEDSKKAELRAKTEADKSRTLSKKWEADLSNKLKALREEQKKWNANREDMHNELVAAQDEAEKLRNLVCEAEVRELGWKQDMQSVEIHVSELERLRREAQETARQEAMTQAQASDSRAEMLGNKLQARDGEFEQVKDLYESQIAVLSAKLQDALQSGTQRNPEKLKAQLESSLVASRAQQEELRGRITELSKKNTLLHATLLELQSSMPTRTKSESRPALDMEDDSSPESDSGSPMRRRNRRHRVFSDSEMLEATSYNQTPPLEPVNSRSLSAARPFTPPGTEGTSASKDSQTSERYFGRGGVQNLRKDKKDKKEDKERKKSGALRGIRGYI
ncbi:Hamartin protein-domain-containing protein [Xylariaceae sp. FL0016]|nr:Hamartin protein-domain-containing protein [Xylariaceae sp. FL0016]